MEFINVFEDSYPLFQLCKAEDWTSAETYDQWLDIGGELIFFEGDPDMIKINGATGYFAQWGDQVFFYFDECCGNAEDMLRAFFATYKTGTTLGGESWICGQNPEGVTDRDSWEDWYALRTGIAYRGSAGYTYWISDWERWHQDQLRAVA